VPRQVVVAPQAEAQIRSIDAWWRRNRSDSPELFSSELAAAFSTLEVAPRTGRPYRRGELRGVRRILLPATRHHVYYLVGTEAVIVLAVWGSVKGRGPALEDLE
jgi:plasmid stabilization system protein ParE